MTPIREWDARSYDALPLPHERWGRRALDRLAPAPGERVLEAGCGPGRDTAALLERLPGGRVVAVDGSANMLERARERLASDLDRVELVRADLTQPLPVREPVDAVFSVATLHWLPDHDAVFRHLHAVLRPGGRLVAEAGGAGNVATVRAALEDLGEARRDPWNFAGPAETERRLRAAGFVDVQVALREDPARLRDRDELERFLTAVVLGSHLDARAEADRAPFVAAVADRLPGPVIDYVRLELAARRP